MMPSHGVELKNTKLSKELALGGEWREFNEAEYQKFRIREPLTGHHFIKSDGYNGVYFKPAYCQRGFQPSICLAYLLLRALGDIPA